MGVAGDEVVDLGGEVTLPIDEPVEELVEPEQDRGDHEADPQEPECLVGRVLEVGRPCRDVGTGYLDGSDGWGRHGFLLLSTTNLDVTAVPLYRQVEFHLEREVVVRLTIYGDFNCPFSALASVRADVLLATGDAYEIDWRAVQHDTAIPHAGEAVDGDTAVGLADEVAAIADLSDHDVRLHLVVPPVRSNTAAACAALAAAGDDVDLLRRRLFAAVWAEGRNLGDARGGRPSWRG